MNSQTPASGTLHILNKPPGHPRFTACLAAVQDTDLLLLTENAVLALVDGHSTLPAAVHGLQADCRARGVDGGAREVDYLGMVELTDRFSRIISW